MQINTIGETAATSTRRYPKAAEQIVITDYKELTDEKLVGAFLENYDEEAFNEVVKRYGDKIYGLALRITRSPGDAEEILQDVLITLMEKLNTFRRESKFSTWLYRVAVNASYIHLNAQKKRLKNESHIESYVPYDEDGNLTGVASKDWSDRPDELLLGREGMEMIENAVNELPPTYRVVFHLRDVEGLSNEEAAKILGLSLPAVKSRILRARFFLRDKLSDYFYELGK